MNQTGPLNRREFLGAVAAGSVTKPKDPAQMVQRRQILNFNENMEYRQLGRSGVMISAVCLGGHWKRVGTTLSRPFKGLGYTQDDFANVNNAEFLKNRHDVISRCIELGINYVDACAGPEALVYGRVLKGRRDKMYIGYSRETAGQPVAELRNPKRILEGLDRGLREAGLSYVDVWRLTLPLVRLPDMGELLAIEEGTMEALQKAKQQGKARFTGLSTHNRIWLNSVIEQYSTQVDVVLFPYTANSKELPGDSVFDAIKKHNVGVFGIKPFADNSLFQGDGSLRSPHAQEDDRRARLAIRYILSNPAITAPIPGLINMHQVDNVALAVHEHRKLDRLKGKDRADLEDVGRRMWAKLAPDHRWLKNWEYV